MKKALTLLTFSLLLPFAAGASSTSFSPATPTVEAGQTFSVTIVVSPSENDYTAKIALSYPSNLLQVVSFTQASGWLPLSQPGYDQVDNASGSLIKTGGFSGGFSSPKVFGTVVFRAVAAGSATISTSAGTQILDANNSNTFSSGGRTTVTITSATALPVVPVQKAVPTTNTSNPTRTPLTPKKSAAPAATTTVVAEATTTSVATTSAPTQNVAAVAGASTREVSLSLAAISVVFAFGCGIFLGKKQGSN